MSRVDVAVISPGRAGRSGDGLRCRLVRAGLPGEIFNTIPLSPAARRHLDACLACQAQAARYRSVLRALRSLRDELDAAPAWLVESVLARLDLPERKPGYRPSLPASAVAASVALVASVAVGFAILRWLRSGSG